MVLLILLLLVVLLHLFPNEVIAYPELGPEALAALTVEDFPAIVVIDSEGNNFYEMGQAPYRTLDMDKL